MTPTRTPPPKPPDSKDPGVGSMSGESTTAFLWGLFLGAVIGVVVFIFYIELFMYLPPQCQEDEVAIHGGIENYYDRHDDLECVNIEEFLVIIGEDK